MTAQGTISFRNLEITASSVTVLASTAELEVQLEFHFDRALPVTSTTAGLTLATLSGQKFGQVVMDFEVDEEAAREIAAFTRAELDAPLSGPPVPRPLRQGNVLSFSGGFDSLAALALMPKETHLVSLDFGGWFEREAKFFRRFDPLVIRTNARSAPHPRRSLVLNHWSFMAMGALLATDYFGARYHSFGNILGDTFSNPQARPSATLSLLDTAGYRPASYTAGLTELGAARVAMQAFPDLIPASLESLAGKTDRKRLLKVAMAHLLRETVGLDLELPPLPDGWDAPVPFTNSYTTALGHLYFVGKGRSELLAPLFSDIPAWVSQWEGKDDFQFHERFDVDYYRTFPDELWAGLVDRLASFGIRPYGRNDYAAASTARNLLNPEFGKPIPG